MDNPELEQYCIVLMSKKSSRLNNKLRKDLETLITLPKTPPHITLRESFFTKNINELIESLKEENRSGPKIETTSKNYLIFDNQYLVLKLNNSLHLQNLHESVMKISQNYIQKFKPYNLIGKLTARQYELLNHFNSPFTFEYYSPHSTIGKIEEQKNITEIRKILDSENLEEKFLFDSIYIVGKKEKSIFNKIPLHNHNP